MFGIFYESMFQSKFFQQCSGPVLNFVFLDFLSGWVECFVLSGWVECFVKANHKLTHRLFPIMDWHGPALADIA